MERVGTVVALHCCAVVHRGFVVVGGRVRCVGGWDGGWNLTDRCGGSGAWVIGG